MTDGDAGTLDERAATRKLARLSSHSALVAVEARQVPG